MSDITNRSKNIHHIFKASVGIILILSFFIITRDSPLTRAIKPEITKSEISQKANTFYQQTKPLSVVKSPDIELQVNSELVQYAQYYFKKHIYTILSNTVWHA